MYGNISLHIVLCGLSDHTSQLLKLHNHIAPTQQFTSCYVRNINSFTVDGFQSKLNTEIL
jgi:hypothetical protein